MLHTGVRAASGRWAIHSFREVKQTATACQFVPRCMPHAKGQTPNLASSRPFASRAATRHIITRTPTRMPSDRGSATDGPFTHAAHSFSPRATRPHRLAPASCKTARDAPSSWIEDLQSGRRRLASADAPPSSSGCCTGPTYASAADELQTSDELSIAHAWELVALLRNHCERRRRADECHDMEGGA
jgi:hypothetical protein